MEQNEQWNGWGVFWTIAGIVILAGKLLALDFYVNSSGNDLNDGLSPQSPWKTVTNINNRSFSPGDRVYFAGGQTFAGSVLFDIDDTGNSTNPILVTSYGNGRATIDADTNVAFAATNCAGLMISNVNFVGRGHPARFSDGISFINLLPGDVILPLVVIQDVEVNGFSGSGITIGGWNGRSGYRDVWITDVSSHDNGHNGIKIYAAAPDVNSNVYIGRCSTYNNFGDTRLAGSGIVVSGVNGGTVEWCVSHDNGLFSQLQGPVGIWTFDSSHITIQFNESYGNRSIPGYDGGGFDLDQNTSDSVLQYNYSHDNDGPGLLQCCGSETSNNIIRYNISGNDSRAEWAGAITTYGNITDSQIYNNTIYFKRTNDLPGAVMIYSPTTNVRIRNNIIWVVPGASLAWIESGQSNLLMQGNDYWSENGSFFMTDGRVDYTSIAAWRSAAGRERLNGVSTGFNVDPKLTGPVSTTNLNDASLLPTLIRYQLAGNSPLIDAGLNLSALNESPGNRDFYGGTILSGSGFDIGAHELQWKSHWAIESFQQRSNAVTFTAVGPLGKTNQIEASTNLIDWTALVLWVNTNGFINFSDPISAGMPRRFYRLHQQ